MTARWPCDAIEVVGGVPQIAMPPRLVMGAESALTRCAIRIWTLRGAWPDDDALGLPWLSWTLASIPLAIIQTQVRRQLSSVEGVVAVLEVTAERAGSEIQIAARIQVDGDDEPVEAVVGDLAVYDGYAVGAWYALLGGM